MLTLSLAYISLMLIISYRLGCYIIIDHFYIALFSTLQQTHCAGM